MPRLTELATYCRVGDEKRPMLVPLPNFRTAQVCPEDVDAPSATVGTVEGAPPNWTVRIVFDKLLDPDIEDLVPVSTTPGAALRGTLVNTQPVTLTCNGVVVPYDGYYAPNGSAVSWPPGPGLLIQPNFVTPAGIPVAPGSDCTVAIKDVVVNKKNEQVPTDQRSFSFKIGTNKFRFSAPDATEDDAATGKIELDPDAPVDFYFTAEPGVLPPTSDFIIISGPNTADDMPNEAVCGGTGTAVPAVDIVLEKAPKLTSTTTPAVAAATTSLILELSLANIAGDHLWEPQTTYLVKLAPTASVPGIQGGAPATFPADFSLCFHTTDPAE